MNNRTVFNIGLGLLGAIICVFVTLQLLPTADAQTSGGGTCSLASVNTGVDANLRGWMVIPSDTTLGGNPVSGCVGSTPSPAITLRNVNSGSSIILKCFEGSSGVAAPQESETVTIKGFPDNDNFGSTGATPIWTWNPGATCNSAPTFTAFCTSDGTSGGSARYGLVRIQVHAVRTTVVAYDVNSEQANPTPSGENDVGVYRCNPQPTVMQPTNQPSGATPWKGGQTYDARVTVNSAAYGSAPGNTGNLRVACNNKETSPASFQFSTSASVNNNLLEGSPDVWQTGCTLLHNATLTKTSSISLYSGTDFAIWDQASPPASVTFPSSKVATFTSHTLNRLLQTSGTCTHTLGGVSVVVINRGQTLTSNTCSWQTQADSTNVPNNQFGRAWYQRSANYRVTVDFPSLDGGWGASGDFSSAITATTSATTTTGLNYHKMMEEFSCSGRTDSCLQNWGNSTGLFDVTLTATFDGITIAKMSGGQNTSTFVISADTEFVHTRGLRDANGNAQSGVAVACQRTRSDSTLETAVSMGNTVASGNSPEVQFQVLTPQGQWSMTCTASFNGNSATYTIMFFHVPAFSGDTSTPIIWNVTVLSNSSAIVNISARPTVYDPASDGIICSFPDDVVHLDVRAFNVTTRLFSDVLVNHKPMVSHVPGTGCAFSYLFYAPQANLTRGADAFVSYNQSGRPLLNTEGYILTPLATNFTAAQTQLVIDMTTFFGTPMMTVFPLLILLLVALVGAGMNKRLPLFFMGFIDLFMVFMAASSVTSFSTLGFDFSQIAAALLLATTLITFIKAFMGTGTSSKQRVV